MPSGMLKINDPSITHGMNTVDDPKTLKPGECVRLLNMFPGKPPKPRNGCTGYLMTGTTNYKLVPPGISLNYDGVIYVIFWIADTSGYKLLATKVDDASFTSLGSAVITTTDAVIFDLLDLSSCIYAIVSHDMTTWNGSSQAISHKVIESNAIIRDMCIEATASALGLNATTNQGAFNEGKYVEYAFNYVRRNDSDAFEAGSTPSGMILPAGITSGYQPKKVETFLPGSCIGVETASFRSTIVGSELTLTPTVGMLTNSGFANYTAAQCVDGNNAVKGFDADTGVANGSYLKIDFGEDTPVCLSKFKIYLEAGTNTNVFKLQYSDSGGGSWVDASAETTPDAGMLNTITGFETGCHRYWRLLLVGAGADGADIMYIDCFGKSGSFINLAAAHPYALAQGATHIRVSRSLEQDTEVLAQGATKWFLFDLPLNVSPVVYYDNVSNAALTGEENQLVTGYSVAPAACFSEFCKGRLFLLSKDGKGYYSEAAGGDGSITLEIAHAYPQYAYSLFKPTEYYFDADYIDGQLASGMKRLGDDLFIFKERKIFAIYGGDPLFTTLSQVSNVVGCSFPYTITSCEIKGLFGNCLLFMSNDGPMVLQEGGKLRPFAEFRIKQLWPGKDDELYSELDTDYNWIVHNCTAAFYKNTWWVFYVTKAGVSRIFGYYFDPDTGFREDAPNGPLELEFAEMN